MKKILLLAVLLVSAISMNAADQLKINSFEAPADCSNDDYEYFFEITLDNEVADKYTALEFRLFLPEGLEVKDGADGFEFTKDRFGKIVRGNWICDHAINVFAKQKDGGYLVSLADAKLSKIHGTSGTVLNVYYTTTKDYKGGEIAIKTQKLLVSSTEVIRPEDFVMTTTGVKEANADEASVKAQKFMTKKGLVIAKGNKKYNAAAQEVK